MENGRKVVTLYVEKSSWLKSNLDAALTIELLPESKMRIQRKVGIGMKGIPEKIVAHHNLRDGPVEIEVIRNESGDAAVEVYVAQIEEIATGGAMWVVSTIRDRLVFSGKTDRGLGAETLVRQAMAALGTHPRASSSLLLEDDAEDELARGRSNKRARTTNTVQL